MAVGLQFEEVEISSSFKEIDDKSEFLDKLGSARINLQKKLEAFNKINAVSTNSQKNIQDEPIKGTIWAKNENHEKTDSFKNPIQLEDGEKSSSSKVTLNESQASNKINLVYIDSQKSMKNEPKKDIIWVRKENLEKSDSLKDPIQIEDLSLNSSDPVENQSKIAEKEALHPISINSNEKMQNKSNRGTILVSDENLNKSESLKDPIELEDMDLSCPDPMINQSRVEEKVDLEETLETQEKEKDLNVFYCCPECAYKSKDVNLFQIHALENHPLSMPLFMDDDTNNR